MSVRGRVYETLEGQPEGLGRKLSLALATLIALNVIAVVCETVAEIQARYEGFFWAFEAFSVAVFSVEYLARLWSCTASTRYSGAVAGRLRFLISPLALVDLLAVLPFYLPHVIAVDLRFVRALRLVRLVRGLKLVRYSAAMRTLGRAIHASRDQLAITVFVGLVLLVFSSSLMYFIEREAQPEAFSSIPAAMWWGVSTLTTVGYGDIYPVTPLGKLIGAIIGILGIGLFALPCGILASSFSEEVEKERQPQVCPHCGKELEAPRGLFTPRAPGSPSRTPSRP